MARLSSSPPARALCVTRALLSCSTHPPPLSVLAGSGAGLRLGLLVPLHGRQVPGQPHHRRLQQPHPARLHHGRGKVSSVAPGAMACLLLGAVPLHVAQAACVAAPLSTGSTRAATLLRLPLRCQPPRCLARLVVGRPAPPLSLPQLHPRALAPPPVLRPAARRKRGLKNLTVITADLVDFQAPGTYDRVVSIECFEHMKAGHRAGTGGRAAGQGWRAGLQGSRGRVAGPPMGLHRATKEAVSVFCRPSNPACRRSCCGFCGIAALLSAVGPHTYA